MPLNINYTYNMIIKKLPLHNCIFSLTFSITLAQSCAEQVCLYTIASAY